MFVYSATITIIIIIYDINKMIKFDNYDKFKSKCQKS